MKEYSYKRRNSYFDNMKLEEMRISKRVDKMLDIVEKELNKEKRKKKLMRKYYFMWKELRKDKLSLLRKSINSEVNSICSVEIVNAFDVCYATKKFLLSIHEDA